MISFPIRAAVFDFDGLILDTEWPEVKAWQEIFNQFDQELPSDWWIGTIGKGADHKVVHPLEILEQLTKSKLDHRALDLAHWERRIELTNEQPIMPGIEARLNEADSKGIALGIASSSRHAWVDGHLQRLGIYDRFSVIVCADDVSRTKPEPDLYLEACRRLGFSAESCIAFEDSPTGARAAKTAGLKVAAVPNSLTKTLEFDSADVKITSLDDSNFDDFASLF